MLPPPTPVRRLALGAEPLPDGGVHFRVWAPDRRRVEVVLEGGPGVDASAPLSAEGGGWFSGTAPDAGPETLYRFRLDGEAERVADPASRFQPRGPEGPSEVIDPGAFAWSDGAWEGLGPDGQVFYELHVGTFTPEGIWQAAARRLPLLADLGVTAIELMPVAAFAGRFGWGYDGVQLFAPHHVHGRPEALRAFVDAAHGLGIGVLLDVVFNHIGPVGNVFPRFGADWLSRRHETDWGPPLDFDGPGRGAARELVLANVEHWVREYRMDGFRLDATQDVHDDSEPHVLAEVVERARAAADGRGVLVVGENEPQRSSLLAPRERGGWGLDALWNDDLHHAAVVALTGRKQAYYSDYRGEAAEFVAAARHGFLYQGQLYPWQGQRRGEPFRGPPRALVAYLENHDQVANSERGERLHALSAPGAHRAMTAFLLLGPASPLLFQGQEWNASSPFHYFADHAEPLARDVREGRLDFLAQFPPLTRPEVRALVPDPGDEAAFRRCVLDWTERERPAHARALALHRDLLRLRREDPAIAAGGRRGVDAAVLTPTAWLLRWSSADAGDETDGERLLVVNLGRETEYAPPAEPLLAPPRGRRWALLWSSEDPAYGGRGIAEPEGERGWVLPGPCAVLLRPAPRPHGEPR